MTYPPNSDPRATRETFRSLILLLILAGVAIGALFASRLHDHRRQSSLLADNHTLQTRLAFIEARHGELLSFLAQPQTQLIKLTGASEWTGQALTIAYNPVQRSAVVLIDRLPPLPAGTTYQLRAITPSSAIPLGAVNTTSPTEHIYSVPPAVGDRFRFDITLATEHDNHVVFHTVKT